MRHDDMPDEIAFTIRVNKATNPSLVHALWELRWGSRNQLAVHLMALGLAVKDGGAAVPDAFSAQLQPKKRAPRKRSQTVPVPAPPPFPHRVSLTHDQVVAPTASNPSHLPQQPVPEPVSISVFVSPPAPTASEMHTSSPPPTPAHVSSDQPPAPPSGLSALLGQFDLD